MDNCLTRVDKLGIPCIVQYFSIVDGVVHYRFFDGQTAKVKHNDIFHDHTWEAVGELAWYESRTRVKWT